MHPDGPQLLPGMLRRQGLESKTFTPLPFDNLLSAAECIDYHMRHSARHPVMVWTKNDEGIEEEALSWAEYGRGIHRAARVISEQLGYDLDKGEQPPQNTYVAILASGDHPTYLATALAVIRAGCCCFPLSNNNSLPATLHLLKAKNCALLIGNGYDAVPHLAKLAEDALTAYPCKFLEWIGYERLFGPTSIDQFHPLPAISQPIDLDRPVLCFHSSGSTSFPKPIEFTDRKLIHDIRSFNYQDFDFTDRAMFLGHLPCFHVMCFCFGAVGMLGTSSTYATFQPVYPPAPIAPDKTLKLAARLASYLVAVPVLVNIWAREEKSIELLKQFDIVGFGGGPLTTEIGDMLVDRGVNLFSVYSSTEIGAARLNHDLLRQKHLGRTWNYNHDLPVVKTFFRPQDDSSGYYEYLVAGNDQVWPNVYNDEYNGIPVFATNDLVELHPDDPKIFRIVGRKDDQIMLSSGEKTNPNPLVGLVEKSPLIKSCLYFGRSKPHNGVLVEPSQPIDTQDEAEVAQFRRLSWPFVQAANDFAPSHSRVLMEMIVVGKSDKPFERTAKGTLRSGIILAAYDEEIEAAYKAFEHSAEVAEKVPLPSLWDAAGTTNYTRLVVSQVLDWDELIKDDQDIFIEHGADSLAATRIRNTISASLAKSKRAGMIIATTQLPTDVVYRNPTIESLAMAVARLVRGDAEVSSEDMQADRLAAMEAMYSKYSQNWPQAGAKKPSTARGKVAVVTGTTGGLGSHVLEKMIRSKEYSAIWALNRGKGLMSRQKSAFEERGLDVELLKDDKVHLLEVNLTKDNLGLDASTFVSIASTVTVIYHIAWRLDFNLTLKHFEQNIKGTRSLLDLAIVSSASFFFASSISVALQRKEALVMETPLPFSTAVGLGYAECKIVTERILETARQECGVKTCSVRVGQLSGSTTNGYWATSDWVPILVKSGVALGNLPTREEQLAWIPTDVAADALLDLSDKDQTKHIVQIKSISWTSVMEGIAKQLNLTTIPSQQWLALLESKAGNDVEKYPALKIFPFFKSTLGSSTLPTLDCTKSFQDSQHLRSAEPLSARDSNQWISFWRSKKLF